MPAKTIPIVQAKDLAPILKNTPDSDRAAKLATYAEQYVLSESELNSLGSVVDPSDLQQAIKHTATLICESTSGHRLAPAAQQDPLWLRNAVARLAASDATRQIKRQNQYTIEVSYASGMARRYGSRPYYKWGMHIGPEDAFTETDIKFGYEFPINPADPDDPLRKYFYLPRSTIDQLTQLDIELLVQETITKRIDGYIPRYFTPQQRQMALRQLSRGKYMYQGGRFWIGSSPLVAPLIDPYVDVGSHSKHNDYRSTYRHAFNTKLLMYSMVGWIICYTKLDLSITSIYRALNKRGFGPLRVNPTGVLAAIRQLIGKCEVLADAHPNIFELYLTAQCLDIPYMPIGATPPRSFTSMYSGEVVADAGAPYDLLILINYGRDGVPSVATLDRLRSMSKKLLVLVDKNLLDQLPRHLKPDRIATATIGGPSAPRYLIAYR